MYSRGGISIRLNGLRRFRHEQEEVLVPALIQQQSGGDLRASQPVAQDEVAVAGQSLRVGERDLRAQASRADIQLMRRGVELLDRHAGRQHAGQVELAARRFALVRVRSLDELVCRAQRLALALFGVARSDDRRVDEFVDAVGRHEQLGVLELDDDRVARQHVGQLHREHVGTTLFQQRRALALALGGFEFTCGLLAFPDRGHGAHIADGHRHPVDCRPRRRREDVAGVDGPRAAILVHLPDGHIRNHAGDRDVDARVLQRQPIDGGISAFDEEVRRQRLVGAR